MCLNISWRGIKQPILGVVEMKLFFPGNRGGARGVPGGPLPSKILPGPPSGPPKIRSLSVGLFLKVLHSVGLFLKVLHRGASAPPK